MCVCLSLHTVSYSKWSARCAVVCESVMVSTERSMALKRIDLHQVIFVSYKGIINPYIQEAIAPECKNFTFRRNRFLQECTRCSGIEKGVLCQL